MRKEKEGRRWSSMLRTTKPPQTLDGEYVIKVDYGRLALVPEADGAAFVAFDCVLFKKGTYKSDVKFVYKTGADFARVPLFTKVTYSDDREGLVVYCQDTDLVHGATKAGKYIGVISLPLKARQYKTETDVFYLGDQELKSVKSFSADPANDTPDLEGFVKSFAPYKQGDGRHVARRPDGLPQARLRGAAE